jgi:dihydroorotate dehydrogenase
MAFYPLVRPLFFALDAERAHRLTIRALKLLPAGEPPHRDPVLGIRVGGIDFPNPVGLAAGFDKDAEVFAQMLGYGFGFVEVGTLTPRPQEGNARPRLFRLKQDRAVINRMGFNNGGLEDAKTRLAARNRGRGLVGVNVGANRDSGDRIADYVEGIKAMAPLADYLTVNISSPNTPGLRGLQEESPLRELLSAGVEARGTEGPPIFLKLAPDLEKSEIDAIARVSIDERIDALIIGNTTTSRPALASAHIREAGGLSGAPLKGLALQRLRDFRSASGGQIALVAAGGIENGVDAFERIKAGASLVQLYSALVYQGPDLAMHIVKELKQLLRRGGFKTLAEAVGSGTHRSE